MTAAILNAEPNAVAIRIRNDKHIGIQPTNAFIESLKNESRTRALPKEQTQVSETRQGWSVWKCAAAFAPLAFILTILVFSYCVPFQCTWNQEKGESPEFERDELFVEYPNEPLGDLNGWSFGAENGRIFATRNLYLDGAGGRYSDAECNEYETRHPGFRTEFLGIVAFRTGRQGAISTGAVVPMWWMLAISMIPLAWAIRRRFSKRTAPGLCSQCGYDLRATPHRCPECGLKPCGNLASPLAVPGVDLGPSAEEIVGFVREGRERV